MYSDSDENISNEFSYNFKNMSVFAKGPSLNTNRNNNFMMPQTQMSRDFMQPEDTRSLYDSRSVYSRRNSSSKSIRSVCDFQPRNFNFSHHAYSRSTQSVYNFQDRNPPGVTFYANAAQIILSLEYNEFNKLDVKNLKKSWKRFLQRYKDSDSGEQGSDSSLSNDDDDNGSARRSVFKENLSSFNSRISRQKSLYRGSSHNFRQKHVRNAHAINISELPNNFQSRTVNAQPLQKDRFKNRHLLPSQRFNRSTAATVITENSCTAQPTVKNGVNEEPKYNENNNVPNNTFESDHETIFSNITVENNNNKKQLSGKRKIEEDTAILSKKRLKLSPIKKHSDINLTVTQSDDILDTDKPDDFLFRKPSFPIKKSCKAKIKNNAVNKRAQPLDHIAATSQLDPATLPVVDESVDKSICEPTENCSANVSTRPSFIKRKLFTQKLDVAENKNISFENVNSPIATSSQIHKERNKTRKLVSNLSCLNRDDTQETNYIELIHKIVSSNQINTTNQRNKVIDDKKEDADKWDVNSIISELDSTDGSNTYTDEDIFQQGCTKKKKFKKKITVKNCHVTLERNNIAVNSKAMCATSDQQRIQHNVEPKGNEMKSSSCPSGLAVEHQNKQKKFLEPVFQNKISDNKTNIRKNKFWNTNLESDIESRNVQKEITGSQNKDKDASDKIQPAKVRTNTFWDVDFESDFEFQDVRKKIPESQSKDKASEIFKNKEEPSAVQLPKSPDDNNRTSNTLTSDNISDASCTSKKLNSMNFKVRSHRAPKEIKTRTEIKVPVNTITEVKSKCKQNDRCTANNKREENIGSSETQVESTKTSCHTREEKQDCKAKHTDDKADECRNVASVVKRILKRQVRSKKNYLPISAKESQKKDGIEINKRRMKRKSMSNKIVNSLERESDISFSLLETTIVTRSRKRAIMKLMNKSNCGNTDKCSQCTNTNTTQNNLKNIKGGKNSKK